MKKLPKYIEIEDYFIEKIQNKELNNGDRIPTEQELIDYFHTSRMTVNKALTSLANKGYISRNRRAGSSVSNRSLRKDLAKASKSMTQDIINAGMKPGTILLDYRVIRGKDKPDVAKRLELADGDYIHYFARVRLGDGKPVAISYSYISAKVLPEINVACLEGSFNDYISSKNIKRTHLYSEIAAVLPTEEQKKILGYDNVALLRRSLVWYVDKTAFEYTVHYLLGNHFEVSYSLDKSDL